MLKLLSLIALAACMLSLAACGGEAHDTTMQSDPASKRTAGSSAASGNTDAESAILSAGEDSPSAPAGYISVDGSLIDENAVAVDLNGLSIANISELSKLTKVKSAVLFNNSISDISALSGMSALTELALSENDIDNIEPLRHLSNLVTLELDYNNITDITPLAGLNNLKSLYLSGNDNISDVSALKGLTVLDNLYLPNNNLISDIQKAELQAALPNCRIVYGGAMGTRPERQYGADIALYTLPFDAFTYTAEQLTDGIWVKRGDKFASLNNKRELLRSLEENVVVVTEGDQIIYKSSSSMPDSISLNMYDSVGYKFGFGHDRGGTVTQIDSRSNLTKTEIRVGNRVISINGNTDLDTVYYSLRGDTAAEIKAEIGTSEKTVSVIPNLEQLSDYAYVSNLEYTGNDSGYVVLDMTHIVMSGNYAFSVDGTQSEIFYFQQNDPSKEKRGENIWAFLRYANNYTGGVYRADVIPTEETVIYGLSGERAVDRSVTQTIQPNTKLHIAGFMITDDDELVAKVVPDSGSETTFGLIFDIDKYTLHIHDGVSSWGSDSLHIVNLPFLPRGGESLPLATPPTSASADSGSLWIVQPAFEYERIMYCSAHGFFDNRGTRGGTSYVVDENLNRSSEHLGHGGELVPFVFHHEWTGEWEVMNDVRDLGWNPEWTGASLDEYFNDKPFSGHYVSGHLDNDWIAGRVGVIHNNEVVGHSILNVDNAYWLGSVAAFRSGNNNRWTLLTEDGREIAAGLFDVKGGVSAKYDESSKYFAVHNGDAWGVVSIEGTVVIPYEYEDIMVIDNTRAYAKQNGKYGVLELTSASAAVLESAIEGQAEDLTPNEFAAYYEVMQNAIDKHGLYSGNNDTAWGGAGTGVGYAELIDFNRDGVSELLFCYGQSQDTPMFSVFGYNGTTAVELTNESMVWQAGDPQIGIEITSDEDELRYICTHHDGGSYSSGYEFSTLAGDSWQQMTVLLYEDYEDYDEVYTLNGSSVSKSEFEQTLYSYGVSSYTIDLNSFSATGVNDFISKLRE